MEVGGGGGGRGGANRVMFLRLWDVLEKSDQKLCLELMRGCACLWRGACGFLNLQTSIKIVENRRMWVNGRAYVGVTEDFGRF